MGSATQAILAAITPMRGTATEKGIAIGAGQPALGAVIMVRPVMRKLVVRPLAMLTGIVIGAGANAMMVQQPVTLTPPTAKPYAMITIIAIGTMGAATQAILAAITPMRGTATEKGIATGKG